MSSIGTNGYTWYYILKTWRFELAIVLLYVFVVLNLEANASILTSVRCVALTCNITPKDSMVGRWNFPLKWSLFWGTCQYLRGYIECTLCTLVTLYHCISKCGYVSQGHELTALSRERERELVWIWKRWQNHDSDSDILWYTLQSDVTGQIIATSAGLNHTPKGGLVWISSLYVVWNWRIFTCFLFREGGQALHRSNQANGMLKEGLDLSFYLSQVRRVGGFRFSGGRFEPGRSDGPEVCVFFGGFHWKGKSHSNLRGLIWDDEIQ